MSSNLIGATLTIATSPYLDSLDRTLIFILMEQINIELLTSLRQQGKKYTEIAKETGIARSTILYWCRKLGYTNPNVYRKPSKENIESFQLLYNQTGSSLKVAKITGWAANTVIRHIVLKTETKLSKEQRVKNNIQSIKKCRAKKKAILIEYKGGACEKCGYNKCSSALEFHHKDPSKKDFSISRVNSSIELLKREVDKCILICSNCHREVHEKLRNNIPI